MNKYELLYIISSSETDESKEAIINKIKALIEKNGGENITIDKWGMRKFAYPINFKDEGYYVLVSFNAPAEAIKVINNTMNITESVVRQMFIKK